MSEITSSLVGTIVKADADRFYVITTQSETNPYGRAIPTTYCIELYKKKNRVVAGVKYFETKEMDILLNKYERPSMLPYKYLGVYKSYVERKLLIAPNLGA
ncbi:MAG: hypothetical protein IM618_14155 [Cytophagales bacterium]|nr:hypothetical protein [Cytophagales bacterium]